MVTFFGAVTVFISVARFVLEVILAVLGIKCMLKYLKSDEQ